MLVVLVINFSTLFTGTLGVSNSKKPNVQSKIQTFIMQTNSITNPELVHDESSGFLL